jgi:hypothetical protein
MGWIHRISWPFAAVALLIAILSARLAWIAGNAETGWETIADDCHAAVIGQFFGYRLPLHLRTLTEQTQYWNGEVDRVLAQQPIDPKLIEGALWILNTPFYDYRQIPSPAFAAIPEIDVATQRGIGVPWPEANPELSDMLEAVMKLVNRAATEVTNSLDVWRTIGFQILPFQKNAQYIFKECRSHDPDNAFYDYYSSYLAMEEAYRVEPDKGHELRQRAIQDIEAGLQKKSLEFPVESGPVIEFLSKTMLPNSEQLRIALAVQGRFRGPSFLSALWAELLWPQRGDTDAIRQRAETLLLPFTRQMLEVGVTPHTQCSDLVQYAYAAVRQLTSARSQLSPELSQRKSATLAKLDAAQRKWNAQHPSPSPWNTWPGYAARISAEFTIRLLLVAVLAAIVAQFFKSRIADASKIQTRDLGAARQLIAWAMSLLLTIVLFGLAPAGVIPAPVQAWVLTGLFLALLTLLPLGVASWWGGRFSLSVLLKLVLFYAIVFGFLNYWNISTGALHAFPNSIRVNPHDFGTVPSTRIQAALGLADNSPRWIALQWVLFHGAMWTIALALLATGWWTLDRARRTWKQSGDGEATPKIRRYWLAWVVSGGVARAAAAAAVVALAVFLALEPERIEHFEAIYLSDYQRVHNPDAYWGGLKQEQEKLINEMRADVEEVLDKT